MPYTKEELKDVSFYTKFIDKLRHDFVKKIVSGAKRKFRDSANTLLSYEDIDTGFGLENAQILNNSTYSTLPTELDRLNLDASYFEVEQGDDYVTPAEGLVPWIEQYSKTIRSNERHVYDKEIMDNIIDRSITELVEDAGASTLPSSVNNGDIITSTFSTDFTKWLLEGNKKRKFPSLNSFFAEGYQIRNLKVLSEVEINSITDGEDMI
jgi:hypothetical protein